MCLFFKSHMSYDEAMEALNEPRSRTITWSEDVVKAAGKIPKLSQDIIANADYRKELQSHNVARILAIPANKNLALNLVNNKQPNLEVLQEFKLNGIYKISENHDQFFLNLLNIKQNGQAINAFNEIPAKPSYISNLAIKHVSICRALTAEHFDILKQLKFPQLKEIADKHSEFGKWLVQQPELMEKFSHFAQKKLQQQFPSQPSFSETSRLLS